MHFEEFEEYRRDLNLPDSNIKEDTIAIIYGNDDIGKRLGGRRCYVCDRVRKDSAGNYYPHNEVWFDCLVAGIDGHVHIPQKNLMEFSMGDTVVINRYSK